MDFMLIKKFFQSKNGGHMCFDIFLTGQKAKPTLLIVKESWVNANLITRAMMTYESDIKKRLITWH